MRATLDVARDRSRIAFQWISAEGRRPANRVRTADRAKPEDALVDVENELPTVISLKNHPDSAVG
jgi:hypothetical protein